MFRLLLVSVLTVGFSVAFAQETPRLDSAADIIGRRYTLASWNGDDFKGGRDVTLEFVEGPALAGAVCNRFRGPFSLENGILTADALMMTRMACPDAELTRLENALTGALRIGAAVIARENGLALRRDDNIFLFRAVEGGGEAPAPAPVPAPASAQTSWKDLEDKRFVLDKVDGEEFRIRMGRQPFIRFGGDGRVSGSACNNFSGPGELTDGVLTVANAASTMMMCVDQNLVEFERYFHKMLRSGVKAELSADGRLTLSGDGRTLEYLPDDSDD